MTSLGHEKTVERQGDNISSTSPLVSIVCLSYNRRNNVLELLGALRHQDFTDLEVILVDNDSQDGTVDVVEASYPHVQVIRCAENHGMVSYNFGFERARGEYILVIDDDGLPASTDWISRVVACFESNPQLGAVACTIRMRDTGLIAYDNPQHEPGGDPNVGLRTSAFNGTGAGLRATALHQVGFYPFHFFRSYLEFHLCTRLFDAGWQVLYFPHIEVWHSRVSGSTNRPATYYGLRNYFWYVWTLYPWPRQIAETVRYLGYCGKLATRGQLSVGLMIRVARDLFVSWPRIRSHRQPVSGDTVAYLNRIRRHHDPPRSLPEHVAFRSIE